MLPQRNLRKKRTGTVSSKTDKTIVVEISRKKNRIWKVYHQKYKVDGARC